MGFVLGRKPEHETLCFSVAAAGNVGYLVCAAVAAAVVPGANRFSLGVLQCVVVHVCVGSYRVFWNSVADRSGMAA